MPHRRPFVIEQLELFNWGPFAGLHRIRVDPRGTAIIGQTGSGKTTLVDALMTLIAERPLYNLASTGGHESDRDLISYIRGKAGEGNESGDSTHICRPGATVTVLGARLGDGRRQVVLGALFWLDGTSSAMTDLKRLWLFHQGSELGVADWLAVHREGGVRALKQFLREQDGQLYDTKSGYLTRLQRFFEVGRNAFALLNRSAGLKQLNSVDQLFRELVLEDTSAYERAAKVVEDFEVLTSIHAELETARRQQQALLPIAAEEKQRRAKAGQVERLAALQGILPIWFAGHAYRLWERKKGEIDADIAAGQAHGAELGRQEQIQEQRIETLYRAYLGAGGGNIEQLRQQIDIQDKILAMRQRGADDYRKLVASQGLDRELTATALARNQVRAGQLRSQQQPRLAQMEQDRDRQAGILHNARTALHGLEQELAQAKVHADSNLPAPYLAFKQELAEALGVDPDAIAFIAELVEVKPEENAWRGAIERALGGQRLRLIVPGAHMRAALGWVNGRDNRLHVRLLDAAAFQGKPQFFADGYTHKLNFAAHPLCEALKRFLSEHDLHCVTDTDQLHRTPHALTLQGTISGKSGRFDKQDQRHLDEGWMTGFDNRDRVRQLEAGLAVARRELAEQGVRFETAKKAHDTLVQQLDLLQRLAQLRFEEIDCASAGAELERLQARLCDLQDPLSHTFHARQRWEAAKQEQKKMREAIQAHEQHMGRLEGERRRADDRLAEARRRRGSGLSPQQSALGDSQFRVPDPAAIERLDELERVATAELRHQSEQARIALDGLEKRLIRLMNAAKREDTGALAEAGTEVRDIPQYLTRLELLTKEALPEKLQRFLDYLNKSSDEGVTQLLFHIDNEVSSIEERIAELNQTLVQVDFQPGRYLQLEPRKVVHEAVTSMHKAQKNLRSAALKDDQGESHYRALIELVRQLRDAAERRKTLGSRALLDPRYRLQFFVKIIERDGQRVIETRTGSQGGSGGEKEIIASYILTASLSYALCPDGMGRPLFGTVVLDEAFSKSSQAVGARIIEALRRFGLHPLLITPNKEMRLLREHTRSAVLVHRKGTRASTTSLSWEELDEQAQRRSITVTG